MKVLITRKLPQVVENILEQYKEIEIDYRKGAPLSHEDLLEAIKDADVIIPVIPDQINKEVIKKAKKLKLIATYSVGYDHIDLETATSNNIYVANTPGKLTESVAEHTIALMLSLTRRITEADRYCRDKKYKYWDPINFIGHPSLGKTIGIVGFGRIGQAVARIAHMGLGMDVLFNDILPHDESANLLKAKLVEMPELLEKSDYIALCCSNNADTHHLIGEPELKQMKPYAYLVNTSRGGVINEDALVLALREGWIAGAALDVFEYEPQIHRELLSMSNVVLTPHIGSATWEARIQMGRMVAENILDVIIQNKPPRYLVNTDLNQKITRIL